MNDITKLKKNTIIKNNKMSIFISKVLISIIILLSCLIVTNHSNKIHSLMKEKVVNYNFKYSKINKSIDKLFGKTISYPKSDTKMVFNDQSNKKTIEKKDSKTKITYNTNSPINALQSGIVVFIGEKDDLGLTVIVQGIDETDIWYSNLNSNNIKLYDYIEKGSVIGDVEDYLIVDIIKNKKHLDYEEYIKKS